MASVRPHPSGGWRAFVKIRGVRDTQVCRTRAEAEDWAARREAEILAGAGGKHDLTFLEAMRRYAREIAPEHKGARWELVRLKAMERTVPFAGRLVAEVTPADVSAWREARLRDVSASSVRREWSLLSSVFTAAQKDWGWIRENPMTQARRPKPPRARQRRVEAPEVRRVCRALGWASCAPRTASQEVALAFLVSLHTGMRSGEILGLQTGDVDLRRRVALLVDTKNGDAREVPLSRAAVRLLRLVAGRGRLFTVSDASRDALFRRATRRAGAEGLHFHDARAAGLTRLSRKVDPLTLAKISGHRDPRVLLNVYYRPDMATIAARL